jgi:hypothetical protein
MHIVERPRLDVVAKILATATALMFVALIARATDHSVGADVVQFSAMMLCVNLVAPRLNRLPKRRRLLALVLLSVGVAVVSLLAHIAYLYLV